MPDAKGLQTFVAGALAERAEAPSPGDPGDAPSSEVLADAPPRHPDSIAALAASDE